MGCGEWGRGFELVGGLVGRRDAFDIMLCRGRGEREEDVG